MENTAKQLIYSALITLLVYVMVTRVKRGDRKNFVQKFKNSNIGLSRLSSMGFSLVIGLVFFFAYRMKIQDYLQNTNNLCVSDFASSTGPGMQFGADALSGMGFSS